MMNVRVGRVNSTAPLGRANSAAPWAALLVLALLVSGPSMAAAGSGRYSHGDVVEFGSDINIPAGQEVSGDVVDFGGNVAIHGKVHGSAVVFGGDLHIYPEGAVEKDTVSFGGEIINDSTSTPPKTKKHQRVVPPQAETPAPMMSMPPEDAAPEVPAAPESPAHAWAVRASIIVPDLLLTLLAFFLFPLRTKNVEEYLVAQPLLAVFLGVLAPFFLVFVLVVLAVLVITIPLIPVALIAFVLAYLIGKAAIAAFLGRRLLEVAKVNDPQPLAIIGTGLGVILVVTGFTPTWFAVIMFSVIGALATGAALVSFMRTRPGLLGVQGTPYATVPAPVATFTPPSGPASGPPAIPQ
ncbi:MAG TPA: hypothetical protein VKF82_09915 [Candidatus Eremiobacteraceae bacterium]|nr:hypothetical protein [Candidatus Eremiobacteraceae bacterium]